MKTKIKKVFTAIIITALSLLVMFAVWTGAIIYRDTHPTAGTPTQPAQASDPATDGNAEPATESEEISVSVYKESTRPAVAATDIAVQLSEENRAMLLSAVKDTASVFRFSSFYAIDEALALYNSTTVNKSTQNTLLTDGLLDAGKLLQKVLKNNEALLQTKSSRTAFYQEAEKDEITRICNEIARVVNKHCTAENIEKTANTLERLTIFEKGGSASNASINTSITFVFSPTMMSMYQNMQELRDTNPETTWQQVIDHEIMHLIQHAANDGDDSNGIEIGFCRMFNVPNEAKMLAVDSLYYSWIFDAAAELSMARDLDIEPGTYQKRISYAASYNLSRFYEIDSEEKLLESMTYLHSLQEIFACMGMEDEDEQKEFLNFMYSIEIAQLDPEEHWEYREAQTGITLNEDEKTGIRMDIRTDAVQYLTQAFFRNLINAVADRAITDLDTVFYMLRLWEIDTCGHLTYTDSAALAHAKEFALWYNSLQTDFLKALAENSGLDAQQVLQMYEQYCMLLPADNEETADNCDLSRISAFMQNYIATEKKNYIYKNYCLISDVADYLQK